MRRQNGRQAQGDAFRARRLQRAQKRQSGTAPRAAVGARNGSRPALDEQEIQRLTVELQRRAAQLEAADRELEVFAYSVSHDLRAPLRSIDGFSQILIEDYAGKLDAEGRGYLQRVRTATQRMSILIEALLMLSRVNRGDLVREKVSLSTLAMSVMSELRLREPERSVEFVCGEALTTEGDMRLLRAALDHLLGNAWKFTRNRTDARIEFGAAAQPDGGTAFVVRDNGVGFDMRYAGKLFGAFQRLHTQREFEGTGIGLATVQRIVRRHGGKVWAESVAGEGASFYFTL